MTSLLDVSLTDQQTPKKCYLCKEGSESYSNVTLEMSSLRVLIKRNRGKKQQKEIEKHQHVIVTENNLFKGFTTKGIRNYDRK